MAKKPTIHWTRWFYGVTHLVIDKGGSAGGGQDVATINRFPDGTCTLWMYNSHDKNLWTDDSRKSYHESVPAAMKIAETRYGVKGVAPVHAMPDNHPNNPKLPPE